MGSAEGWMGWQSRGRPGWIVRKFECDEATCQGKTHGCVVHDGGGDNDRGVGRAHGDGGSAAGDGNLGGGEDGDGGQVLIRGRLAGVAESGSSGGGGHLRGGNGGSGGHPTVGKSSDDGRECCEGECVLHFDFGLGCG